MNTGFYYKPDNSSGLIEYSRYRTTTCMQEYGVYPRVLKILKGKYDTDHATKNSKIIHIQKNVFYYIFYQQTNQTEHMFL